MTCALKDKAFRLLLVSEKMDAKDLFMKTAFGQSACVWNKNNKNKTKRQTQVGFEIMLLGKVASLFFFSKTLFYFVLFLLLTNFRVNIKIAHLKHILRERERKREIFHLLAHTLK